MDKQVTEKTNFELMNNLLQITDWELGTLASELYWWANFFNLAFFKTQPVPSPVLSFEKTRVNTMTHYVSGRNGFGFNENIKINRASLHMPLFQILGSLLDAMCHSWQKFYGNPSNSWFHNKEFREKMRSFGILCSNNGLQLGLGDPFVFLLKKHGIVFPDESTVDGFIRVSPKPNKKGKSKLRKWTCGCQNARVGKAEFFATCDLCGNQFVLGS